MLLLLLMWWKLLPQDEVLVEETSSYLNYFCFGPYRPDGTGRVLTAGSGLGHEGMRDRWARVWGVRWHQGHLLGGEETGHSGKTIGPEKENISCYYNTGILKIRFQQLKLLWRFPSSPPVSLYQLYWELQVWFNVMTQLGDLQPPGSLEASPPPTRMLGVSGTFFSAFLQIKTGATLAGPKRLHRLSWWTCGPKQQRCSVSVKLDQLTVTGMCSRRRTTWAWVCHPRGKMLHF